MKAYLLGMYCSQIRVTSHPYAYNLAVLADFQLEAARDAVSESAKKQFTLEAVEATARKIIAENPQSEWPTQRDCTRLGYQVSLSFLRSYHRQLLIRYISNRYYRLLEPISLWLLHQLSVQASH